MIYAWDVTIPPLTGEKKRRAYIYLPDFYHAEPNRKFPVLYMFDGHNVFFDSDAAYGKSWGLNRYMGWSKKPLIIVAVECNKEGERLSEYSPVSFENDSLGKIEGRGRAYMDWLVKDLKPFIDETFRTLPDRRHTLVCGSSMGGLMALYAALRYNDTFSRAACLSPSIWVAPEKIEKLIDKSIVQRDTRIYMDYGSEELNNHENNREALTAAVRLLRRKRIDLGFRIIPGGSHCEASWEKQIPIFMEWLGL